MGEAILAVVILFPLAITYFLKSNAALGLLALCAGFVLKEFAADDLSNLLGDTSNPYISKDLISMLLIFLPLVITLLFCRGPSSRDFRHPKVLLNLLVAVAAGGVFALMSVRYFEYIGTTKLTDSSILNALEKAQSEVIGIGALLSLVLIWLGNRKASGHNKHHK